MANPFDEGEKVFILFYGEKKVLRAEGDNVWFDAADVGQDMDLRCVKYNVVSYKPWNKPVHTKDIQIGWHLTINDGLPGAFVSHWDGRLWTNNIGVELWNQLKTKSIRFITENEDISKD